MDSPILLRVTEVGDALQLGRTTVYRLIRSGEIPSVRVGGSLRVPAERFHQWLQGKTQKVREGEF